MPLPLLLLALAVPQEPPVFHAGDARFELRGGAMARAEWRDPADLGVLGGGSDDLTRVRGALGVAAEFGAYLHGFAEVLGTWGQPGYSTTGDLQQAWIQADRAFGDWWFRAGRTEMELGDGQLVSASRDWLFEPTAFDALIVGAESQRRGLGWQAWYAEGATGLAEVFDDSFAGGFLDWRISEGVSAEAYLLYRDFETVDARQVTWAARFHGETVGGLDWSGFAAHQEGSSGAASAWAHALVLRFGHRLGERQRLGLEFGLATGDDLDAKQFQRFDPQYMDQHASHGIADVFAFSNLVDLAVTHSYEWNADWTMHGAVHGLWRQTTRDDVFAAYTLAPYGLAGDGRTLGTELDVWAEGRLRDDLALDVGAAWLLATSAFPADDDQWWLFAQLDFTL